MKKIPYVILSIFFAMLFIAVGAVLAWGDITRGWFGYTAPTSDTALEQVIEELRNQLAETETERDKAITERDTAISEKEDAETERDKAISEKETIETERNSLQEILNNLLSQGEDATYLQQQISNLENQLQTANNTITNLNGQISALNNSIQEKNAEISKFNQDILEFLSNTVLLQNAATLYLLGVFDDIDAAFEYVVGKNPFDFKSAGEMSLEVLEFAIEKMNNLVNQSFRICAAFLYDYFSEDFGFEDVEDALEFLREEFIPENTDMPTFTHIFAMLDFIFTEFEYNLWEGFFPV